jgi:hypothetical protein
MCQQCNRPSHLTRDDFHFLSAVAGGRDVKIESLEDEIDHHFATAEANDMRATIDEDDVPFEDAHRHAHDESRRLIRSRSRELQRQAGARDLRLSREAIAKKARRTAKV